MLLTWHSPTAVTSISHMNVLLSDLALTMAVQLITGIWQYISLGFELSKCCACCQTSNQLFKEGDREDVYYTKARRIYLCIVDVSGGTRGVDFDAFALAWKFQRAPSRLRPLM